MIIKGINGDDKKRLIENFFSLSLLNFINYLFPLILIPYLTRILGVDKFGLYAFSLSIIQYCSLLVGFGFDYSATKYIAINRNSSSKVSMTFISIIFIRLVIALICILLILIVVYSIPMFEKQYLLYLYGVGIFCGRAMTPLWLFQGMENMRYVTIINFLSKSISTICIFVFLKEQSDYIYVNLFLSIGAVFSSIVGITLAVKIFKIKFILPKSSFIKDRIIEGWYLFLSTIFMNFYRESNILILGAFTNYSIVGYYAAAEKIIKAVQSILSPISNAIFPYFGRNLNIEDKRNLTLKKFFSFNRYYGTILVVITIILFLFAGTLVHIYLGVNYTNSIRDIKIMSPIILIGGLNYILGIVGLVNLGYEKKFTISAMVAGVVSIMSCIILVNLYLDIGASIAMVIAEGTLLLLIIYQYYNVKKEIFVNG